MDFGRYYHTLRYLTLEQVFFRGYYKTRGLVRKALGIKPCFTRYRQGRCLSFKSPWIEKPVSYKGDGMFCFLNVNDTFKGAWDDNSNGALWRYNLNYMDFLLQPSMDAAEGYTWIDRYISALPVNSVACDPYPISLRCMNWVKFVSLHKDRLSNEQLKRIDTALYSQCVILAERVERHLMANHYLENGFALLFAACYFNDKAFFKKADRILRSQLKEQILPDGAHYELSPMYHCIILERLLDCYNVIDHQQYSALAHLMLGKIKYMLGWLETAVMSDGNIPLLNDSALGIAPMPSELFSYARSLGVEWTSSVLSACGYRKFKGLSYDAFVDVAALGPSYNLGHSHADTFSFVMNVCGRPFLVDTGVSTYSAGERRCHERSTCAHNTVAVDSKDSSRVWGAFRCAERASVKLICDEERTVYASHDGYASMGVSVYRTFMSRDAEFVIVDEVTGAKDKECMAAFHLAPGVEVLSATADKVVTSRGVLSFTGATAVNVTTVDVACEYNILQPSKRVSVSFDERLVTIVLPEQTSQI